MNPLDAMQIFVRVAELASFTRAADSLDMPKASMSMAVQQLETQLGTRLLHRTTRKVQMTQDGRVFYERCKDLLVDVDELQTMFQQAPQALRGRLRVDMPSSAARIVMPQLPQFLQQHPHIELEVSCTDRKVDVVREGFDCVLRVGSIEDTSLVARPLGHLRVITCASPSYLETFGVPRSLEDLVSHRLVHYASVFGARPLGWEYHDGTGYRTVEMQGAITVNSVEGYEAACLAGMGMIQAPAVGMRQFIEQGLLIEVLPQYRAEPMPVALVYAHRRNLSRRVQVFMAWMQQMLAPYLDA